jgi:ureidoglycolate lyase
LATAITLKVLPLTPERFAPYGDVIEARAAHRQAMNSARFDRFPDLANVEIGSGARPAISIARCRTASTFPYRVDMLERHPNGSQAFVPLGGFAFVVAVVPPGEDVSSHDIAAFISNGRQGVNYYKGTWHMPMIATAAGQEFLVVDRIVDGEHVDDNLEEHVLEQPVLLEL